MNENKTNGISVCNPSDLDENYLSFTADYTIKKGLTHYQFIGPIHDVVKGNIDGMTFYKKYSEFNSGKNAEYIKYCEKTVNNICGKFKGTGVKTYVWHHELELPVGFEQRYPAVLNSDGDVEVTHPIIRDFIENKINDFFDTYCEIDGVVLTLHETRVPLLKLKNQKSGKIERVKYITEILYNACVRRGKELIVRPFASIEEDYEMMTSAYEKISRKLVIMDKWTQFDWSLTLPNNAFFKKIKDNPLLIETDIFGEYFGRGFLPIMLDKHISEKVSYCNQFKPLGYVSRIDREGENAFGTVNEVNLEIMYAAERGTSVEKAIDKFFNDKYGKFGQVVKSAMRDTEEIQKKIFYLNGYYFTELSRFPRLNHCKNHFYFELMKDDYCLSSDEWFIPKNWKRGSLENLIKEKRSATDAAEEKLNLIKTIRDKISEIDYEDLFFKFSNLYFVSVLWQNLLQVFVVYMRSLLSGGGRNELADACDDLKKVYEHAANELGDKFYSVAMGKSMDDLSDGDLFNTFLAEVLKSFDKESELSKSFNKENLIDYIICGGGNESHKLKKEVNFSDTYVFDDGICRIPGTNRGKSWSTVNTHGWFSYELKVTPDRVNEIVIGVKGSEGRIDFCAEINGEKNEFHIKSDKKEEVVFLYKSDNSDRIRLRIDRLTEYTPFIYYVKVKEA